MPYVMGLLCIDLNSIHAGSPEPPQMRFCSIVFLRREANTKWQARRLHHKRFAFSNVEKSKIS
jgi:hypothetical protein